MNRMQEEQAEINARFAKKREAYNAKKARLAAQSAPPAPDAVETGSAPPAIDIDALLARADTKIAEQDAPPAPTEADPPAIPPQCSPEPSAAPESADTTIPVMPGKQETPLLDFPEFASGFEVGADERLLVNDRTYGFASIYGEHKPCKEAYLSMSCKHVDNTVGIRTSSRREYEQTGGMQCRKKVDMHRVLAIYLDDVGTAEKSLTTFDALPDALQPSWIAETSPGNHQVGYFLAGVAPVDTDVVMALWKAAGKAVGSDPGAIDPTRWCRGPGCRKDGAGYPTRLLVEHWHPERRYTIEELTAGFGLRRCETPVNPVKAGVATSADSARAQPDPVVAWLDKMGMIDDPMGMINNSNIRIICPTHTQHTSPTDPYALYSPLGQGEHPEVRMFNCFHGHCIEAGINTEYLLKKVQDYSSEVYTTTSPASTSFGVTPEFIHNPETFAMTYVYVKDNGAGNGTPCFFNAKTRKVESIANINHLYAREAGKGGMLRRWTLLPARSRLQPCDGVSYFPGSLDPIVSIDGAPYANPWIPNKYDLMAPEDIPIVTKAEVQDWYDVLELMFPDEFQRNIMLFKLAKMFQDPSFIPTWSILIVGEEGTGKDSVLFKPILTRFRGSDVAQVPPSESHTRFMDYAVNKQVVFMQEIYDPSMDKVEFMNNMKLITSNDPETVTIPRKGRPGLPMPNLFHVFLTSNFPEKAANLAHGNRRIVVLQAAPTVEELEKLSTDGFYSDRIERLKANGHAGFEKVVHHLMTLHVPDEKELLARHGWNFLGRAPMTEAKKVVQEASIGTLAVGLRMMQAVYDSCPMHELVFTSTELVLYANREESILECGGDSFRQRRRAACSLPSWLNERLVGTALGELGFEKHQFSLKKKYSDKTGADSIRLWSQKGLLDSLTKSEVLDAYCERVYPEPEVKPKPNY